jgi:hypothetical protein
VRNAEKQPEAFPLNTGMNQSFGSRMAPYGTLDLVKNCRIRGSGGLVKRCGSSAITGATADPTGNALYSLADTASAPRPTEKAAFVTRLLDQKVAGSSAGEVFVYGGTVWSFQGAVSAAQPVRKRLGIAPSVPTRPIGPSVPAVAATSDGYICAAASFDHEIKITVEAPTGELVYTHLTGGVGFPIQAIRIVAVASKFHIIWSSSNGAGVNVRTLTVASGVVTSGNSATLVTRNAAASCWDASAYDATNWFLTYQSGATTVTVAKMTGQTVSTTATFSSTDNLTYLSVWADPVTDRVWVGLVDDPTTGGSETTAFRVYTDTPTLSVGPTTVATASNTGPPLFGPLYTRTPVAGDAFGVYTLRTTALGAGTSPVALYGFTVSAGTPATAVPQAFNVVPISKPDAQQRVWCMSHAIGASFSTTNALLLRFPDPDNLIVFSAATSPIVELASPLMETMGPTYHPYASPNFAFNAVAVTTEAAGGSAFFGLPFVLTSRTNASSATEPTTRADVYEYTRYNQAPHQPVLANGRAAYVAGQPTELYGRPAFTTLGKQINTGAVEVGFPHGPCILTATATPDAGGLAVGSYVYRVVQQAVDDEGNRQLSAPSPPVTVTLTVPSSVALNISGVFVGQHADFTGIGSPITFVYRTQNGGTEAQQVPINAAEPGAAWVGYVTATDTVSDAIVANNEFIYTAGGVLPNVLAPSCRYLAVSEDRLWCGGLWDSNIIECSKVRIPQEPFNFTGHASHQVVIPGEVSGLAYMDGQVVAFTEDAIYLVAGDGPNDQGAGGFAPPRALVRGIGCPRTLSPSILETEIGILFRSALGFYLIPRGFGTPQYIGGNVEDEDTVVLSAATTTTSEHRLARFLICATGETKADTVLTLDLTNMQWFRDEYTVNGLVASGQGFSEIGEWPDGLALMSYGLDRADNASVIWAESESLTGDAGGTSAGATSYISMYARTAWIYPGGPLGLIRLSEVVLSMEAIGSSSVVTLSVETDGNTAQAPFWTITTSEAVSYRAASIAQPECTCFRVTISDAAGASNSAGVRFLGLGFETTIPGGIRRVTDSERQ